MAHVGPNTPALRIVKGLADNPPDMGYMSISHDVKWWQWFGIMYSVFKILKQGAPIKLIESGGHVVDAIMNNDGTKSVVIDGVEIRNLVDAHWDRKFVTEGPKMTVTFMPEKINIIARDSDGLQT